MAQWYYRRHGRQHGPFSPKQFKQMALGGEVQPSDEIRRDDMGGFVAGTKIEGLFPREPVAMPVPKTGTPASPRALAAPPSRRKLWIAALGAILMILGAVIARLLTGS